MNEENTRTKPLEEAASPAAHCSAEKIRHWIKTRPAWAKPFVGLLFFLLALPCLPLFLLWFLGDMIYGFFFTDNDTESPFI